GRLFPNKQQGPNPENPQDWVLLCFIRLFFACGGIVIFACFHRASNMEQKANSFPFAFVGNAVGERGTVCPRKALCARKIFMSIKDFPEVFIQSLFQRRLPDL
ncbi:hypothetical protein, partial [Anaeromassilibacillus sp. D41t1_190614_C2]|uniref:hypothetical protein n=1 Tax=Anaeromassilibacillus sp. D41t1_190614_C2 TaxID=2787078 RepID=UPI001A9B86DA